MKPSLGSIDFDLVRLLETRMLIQSNAGGGKSFCLRRILEQTAPLVQQLVIDPEGEFASLREKYDYIVCAPSGADAIANPHTAAALARALWQARTSAILDIYELKAHERILFVRRFLEALVNAPRSVWNPALVVIDEAHIFAPQSDKAESLGAVIDLASRGRKRGLSLLAATQRISKLHKDCAAELLNKAIGRTGLDVDVRRAADELGMPVKEATETLRNLDPGEFFVYGPALTRSVERTKIGPVQTTHPQVGNRALVAPPPPSAKVRAQLAKIEGLQREAEEEVKTVASLSQELAKARKELTTLQKGGPDPDMVARETERLRAAAETAYEKGRASVVPPDITPLIGGLKRLLDDVNRLLGDAVSLPVVAEAKKSAGLIEAPGLIRIRKELSREPAARATSKVVAPAPNGELTGPEQRILDAIAWLEAIGVEEPEQPAVAFLAGYSYGGGAFNNPRGRLNKRGFVEYKPDGRIALTDAGMALARSPPPEYMQSNAHLHQAVLARLPGPEQRLLRPLLAAYPAPMSNADLAAAANYTAGAGAFNNPRGRLKSLGLVEYPAAGHVRARDLLFPKS